MLVNRPETEVQPAGAPRLDRCRHPRPFTADFAGCAAYQPVSFLAADSLNRPLPATLTCRHLVIGSTGDRGRFYAGCALGTSLQRRRHPGAAPTALRGQGAGAGGAGVGGGPLAPP